MAVVGSGLLPRKATLGAPILLANRGSGRLPRSRTRVSTPLSENNTAPCKRSAVAADAYISLLGAGLPRSRSPRVLRRWVQHVLPAASTPPLPRCVQNRAATLAGSDPRPVAIPVAPAVAEPDDCVRGRLSEYRCRLPRLRHFRYGSRFRFV